MADEIDGFEGLYWDGTVPFSGESKPVDSASVNIEDIVNIDVNQTDIHVDGDPNDSIDQSNNKPGIIDKAADFFKGMFDTGETNYLQGDPLGFPADPAPHEDTWADPDELTEQQKNDGLTLGIDPLGGTWIVNSNDDPIPEETDRFRRKLEYINGYAKAIEKTFVDGSVFNKVSDKWQEVETWRERQRYLNAVEMTKLSLKTFHGITPDYPGYEDILAVATKEYLRIQEETPALLMGAQGPITKFVYISRAASGVVQYAGITNVLARRAAEHLRTKGIPIEALIEDLSPRDARAVEQVLIEIHGLGSNGGTLMNKINSIAKTNPEYGILIQRGYDLLKSIGYGG